MLARLFGLSLRHLGVPTPCPWQCRISGNLYTLPVKYPPPNVSQAFAWYLRPTAAFCAPLQGQNSPLTHELYLVPVPREH